MANLTQTFAKRVKSPESGYEIHWDEGSDSIAGFGLRVTAAGIKSFLLNYRVHGRQRRYTIGQLSAWTAEAARQEARRLRTLVDRGKILSLLSRRRSSKPSRTKHASGR